MADTASHPLLRQIPNALTLARLIAVPFFIAAMIEGDGTSTTAGIIFAAASLTDWFDGFIARRMNWLSTFGKVVDPFADRLLILSAVGLLVYYDRLPWPAILAVASRDILVIVGFLIVRRVTLPNVNFVGKTGTFWMMGGLGLMLLTNENWPALIFWAGFALSVVAMGMYAVTYRASVKTALHVDDH